MGVYEVTHIILFENYVIIGYDRDIKIVLMSHIVDGREFAITSRTILWQTSNQVWRILEKKGADNKV